MGFIKCVSVGYDRSSGRSTGPRLVRGVLGAFALLFALLVAVASGSERAGAAPLPQHCGFHGSTPVSCWMVDSFVDGSDRSPGDGRCETPGGLCTLRAAIDETLAGTAYSIQLDEGTYRLTLGQLLIPKVAAGGFTYVIITGKGPGKTRISGENAYRVFDIGEGSNLWLRSLTVEKGRNIPSAAYVGHAHGAGIHNHGNTYLDNVAVVGNAASLAGHNSGGGIANAGTGLFTMTNSTVVQNFAGGGGGGIENAGELQIKGSTIVFNMGTTNGASGGGAIYGNPAKVSLDHALVAYNWVTSGTSVTYENCRTSSGAAFAAKAAAYSLSTDTTCGLAGVNATSRDNIAVTLSTSHADERVVPAPGSAAIDTGAATCAMTVDHDSKSRPADGNGDGVARCDIGAFELQPALRLRAFDLVDAVENRGLRTIVTGDVLDRRAYAKELSIEALTEPAAVGSVRFELDGKAVRTENNAPYLLAGDIDGDVAPAELSDGVHTLTATPFAGPDGTGAKGTALTISFTMVTGPAPDAFTLVDAESDFDIQPLRSGDALQRSALPKQLTIRANLDSTPGPASVVFVVDGKVARTENTTPYALAGDVSGDYAAADLSLGKHTVVAIAYDKAGGTGTELRRESVDFSILF